MPDGAVYVGRPSVWGNTFRITRSSEFHGIAGSWFLMSADGVMHHPDDDTEHSARAKAVELFAAQLFAADTTQPSIERIRAELGGHDLVCWCPISEPCHADVLLRVANSPIPVAPAQVAPVTPVTPATSTSDQPTTLG